VDCALVNLFQTVRFLADVFDQLNLYVSPLQQSRGLPAAGASDSIGTFSFRVKFVLGHYIAKRFQASRVSRPTVTLRRDSKELFAVLVNPFLIKPFPGIGIVGRNEVKFLRVDTCRMPKRDHVPSQQEIEWLNLLWIGFARIQRFKAFYQDRAANGSSSDCRKMRKLRFSCPQAARLANNYVPDRRSPVAVGSFRVGRIQKMAETQTIRQEFRFRLSSEHSPTFRQTQARANRASQELVLS